MLLANIFEFNKLNDIGLPLNHHHHHLYQSHTWIERGKNEPSFYPKKKRTSHPSLVVIEGLPNLFARLWVRLLASNLEIQNAEVSTWGTIKCMDLTHGKRGTNRLAKVQVFWTHQVVSLMLKKDSAQLARPYATLFS